MKRMFRPRFDILPAAQRHIWPQLVNAAALGFTLYGGTAIALRLGHRESIDFDFFSERALDRHAIQAAFAFMSKAVTLQDERNTWVVLVPEDGSGTGAVKISFFGEIGFGRVGEPDFSDDGVLRVAALDDLMATKLKVVLQRAEAKDYRDIAIMLDAGVDLAYGLAAARLLFGSSFQPAESLKALVYFDDGDLSSLSGSEKNTLINAVKSVTWLPDVIKRAASLS